MTISPTAEIKPAAFAALKQPGYRTYLVTFMLTMMADNIEHVVSYWVMFQKFHSPALGGFAVVSHWLPFLAFSVAVGALNDRFDSRRIIQCGVTLFILVSVGWGYFFITDTLEMWEAVVLLVLHGCAGVLWMTSGQVLLYDIVGPATLPSAVRLAATTRYLGVFLGPAVGSLIMVELGPTRGIFLNTIFYLPLLLWLVAAPYGRHFRNSGAALRRAVRGFSDIAATVVEVRGIPVVLAMTVLAGGASFFIGNSYQAQMPGFATDLGHADPGTAYSALLSADAAGALLAGVLLESSSGIFRMRTETTFLHAMLWAASLFCFAQAHFYPLALFFLFCAGFFELSFSSMAQAIVQMNAPDASRGRVLGLYNMASAGLRMFSGVTIGLVGSFVTIHFSLAASAIAYVAVMLYFRYRLGASSEQTAVSELDPPNPSY